MRRLWPVVRREYLERVRSKAFLIGTFLGPLLMAGLMVLPGLLMAKQRGKPLRVVVLDASGSLREPVEEALAAQKVDASQRFTVMPAEEGGAAEAARRLKNAVLEGRLDGYLYLPPDALERSVAEYYGKNVSNVMDLRLMDRAVEEALVSRRLAAEGLDPGRVKHLTRRLDLKTLKVSASGEREDQGASAIFSVILLMMLYVTVLMWGQALMTSVIEEKSNRVVEVMVSSIPSTLLLGGKLLGVGAAGLTQFLVWAGTLAAIGAYGASMGAALGGARLPEITPLLLFSFVAYFLLGYLLYAALYASIGASVNSIQEAQSLVFPVIMPLVLSVMFFGAVLESPDSNFSTVVSLIPFFTPLLMFLRITVLTPPAWQIALSMVLTGLTIAGVTFVAARIYRVGILMYGKRPTFPEILRWIRHS